MKKIKAIIADTDEKAVRYLKFQLADVWPELILCGEAKNGNDALDMAEKLQPDVAFFEVRIPGLCGLRVARKIAGSCKVVFISGHDHYAAYAFECQAFDYLLKPVSHERLSRTVKRLKKQLGVSFSFSETRSQISLAN